VQPSAHVCGAGGPIGYGPRVRVVVAPDGFGGTLTAAQAAQAMADGWRRRAPDDELELRPLSDGGTGLVDVLATAIGGIRHECTVTGPLGEPVIAQWLEHDGVGYVECAQACGLHLVAPADRRSLEAGTRGVGELLLDAAAAGMASVVVGLGGSATTDGGAGLLAALGAGPVDADGRELPPGGGVLSACAGLTGPLPASRPSGSGQPVTSGFGSRLPVLVAATDVENPLLGPHGAARVFGPQKGAGPDEVEVLEAGLRRWAGVLAVAAGRDLADLAGAGAAGGLGAALFALGARRESGARLVRALTGLDGALHRADLVLTGEGSFDRQSLRGKLVTAVAAGAAERGVPCLVLAGQVAVGRREAAAVGVEATYSAAEHAGSVAAAMADPAGVLADLAARVAASWSRR
jgi:glycerate kinase